MRAGILITTLALMLLVGTAQAAPPSTGGPGPTRTAVCPGVVKTGRTLHVAFWGSAPGAMLEVEAYPQMFEEQALRFRVRADESGMGRFTLGVPCTWRPAGLIVLRLGSMQMKIPFIQGRECEEIRPWLQEWMNAGSEEARP